MRRSRLLSVSFGWAAVFWGGGCVAPDLGVPCPVPPGATAEQTLLAKQSCYSATQPTLLDPRLHKDVDILFVIDNSPSMAPKQRVLAAAIPRFISAIDATGANYQVGIVTTDLGFNVPDGTLTGKRFAATPQLPGSALTACDTAAGDDGVLQNQTCKDRTNLKGDAAAACQTLCPDPKYVPQGGVRYISKVDGITNVPTQMASGVDIGPQLAFQCLSLVGDTGCAVEQPLEAAKRALDNHRPDNQGFNRKTSVLAVIFITDEDDCSVQLMKRSLLDPATAHTNDPSCTTESQTVNGQCYNVDYRCTALDLECDQPMNGAGGKRNCRERKDSFLSSIDQYVNFFAGLPNPNLVIAGIWTPTLLDNLAADASKSGRLFVNYVNGTSSEGLNRGRKEEAACYNSDPALTTDPSGFFGQAQLRLSSFIRRFQNKNISENSICDAQNYPAALSVIADNIIKQFPVDCLARPPKHNGGSPACVVGYVDASNPHDTPRVTMPACSAKCCDYFATDPAPNEANNTKLTPNPHLAAELLACAGEPDCYCAVPSQVNCGGGAVAGLWRRDNAPPPNGKIVSFQCAVAAPGL